MAGRKSKKVNYDAINKYEWRVGVYLRLSSDDGDNAESDSIKNQRELITYYLENEEGLKIIDYYADDGYSGTSFNRPNFKRMFSDLVNGKINTIIVKDLSRFGRNYIEVGKYIESFFPLYNIRFISINDNVDSFKDPKSINNVVIPFKNLMNDEYARDISNKVRSVYATKAKNGEFVGGTTPYGYKKDPKDKYHLVIDKEEAKIVKLIFNKALSGDGKVRIVKFLNNNKILCRKEKMRRKKRNISFNPEEDEIIYRWSTSTISRLLANETYIGNLVQGKSGNISYKVQKQKVKPKEEWIIVKDKHEPIISKEDFYKVQELIGERRVDKKVPTNFSIYNGILKCADCGKAMWKVEDHRGNRNCSNFYCLNYKTNNNLCSPHKIKTSMLDETILEMIIHQVKMVIDLEKVIKKFNLEKLNNKTELDYKNNIVKYNNDIDKLRKLKKLSYEDWKFEKITREEYLNYSKDYDERIEILNKEIIALEKIHNEETKNIKKDDYWINHFKRNKKIKIITKEVLDELIEKIYVHENENITIKFKYQDEYKQAIEYFCKEEVC